MSARAVIVGATGYTGRELAGLVVGHPSMDLVAAFSSSDRDGSYADAAPELRGLVEGVATGVASVDAVAKVRPDVVFLATPHDVSAAIAPALLEDASVPLIVDLSGGFRLKDPGLHQRFYGFSHPSPLWLSRAVYGLPELDRSELGRSGLEGASLIAAAGCYVTASTLALSPLLRSGLIDVSHRPVIDAVSGVSGAGRGAKLGTSFCEVSSQPYGVTSHRHRPEIEQALGTSIVFQPHLGPFARGILATCHATLRAGVTAEALAASFSDAYAVEPFVRVLGDAGAGAPTPSVRSVERTNFCDLAFAVDGEHVTVFSAIDNLVKGASGQALQCANAALGLPEWLGLLPTGADGASKPLEPAGVGA